MNTLIIKEGTLMQARIRLSKMVKLIYIERDKVKETEVFNSKSDGKFAKS
jgi:hypothetical protein